MSKPQKVAVITGVASDLGIGRATAKLFAQNNYKIIGIDRQAKNANDFPFPIDYYKVNLANSSQIQQCCEQICTKYTAIDVLVNNAGIHGYETIDSTSVERFDEIVAINFRAPWLLCKLLHKLLSKATDGGSIVNISSVHASRTTENRSVYAGTKGALSSVTQSLANEFATDRIRVNAVQPGAIHTNLWYDYLENENPTLMGTDKTVQQKLQAAGKSNAILRRLGNADEIAQCVYFLSDSTLSAFTTGSSLVADAGLLSMLIPNE